VQGGRHHADHGERLAVEHELLVEHVRVAGEAACPEPVAQQRDALRAHLVLRGREGPPQLRLDAQRGEYPRGHLAPVQPLRLIGAGEHAGLPAKGDDSIEDFVLIAQILEVLHRKAHVVDFFPPLRDEDQVLPFGVRKRLEQHAVDDAENRRVRPDAQGEGQHGQGGESR
jgi:hypothetical protein